MIRLHVCPSTLAEGHETYSPSARKMLFDGAGGADAPVTYWGSAEITAERAITCFFSFASTAGNNTKDQQYETNFRVRYILAF